MKKKISRKNVATATTALTIQLMPYLQQFGLNVVNHIQLNALLMPFVWFVFVQRKIDEARVGDKKEYKNKFFQLPFVTTVVFAVAVLLQIIFKKDMDSNATEMLVAGISTVTVTVIGIVTRWRAKN